MYCIPCVDCPATYVRETKSRLGKRIDEPKRAVQITEVEFSPLAEHVCKSDHRVDWVHVAVLDYITSLREWLTMEAYHIRRQPLPLNRDCGMLPAVYDQLMRVM